MTDERAAGGAALDPEEAALLAALRARGLNELAEMALFCFGESYGHAGTALREFEAAPPPACSLGLAHASLTPGAQCPSCQFIAPELPPEVAAVHEAAFKAGEALQRKRDEQKELAAKRVAQLQPAAEEFFRGYAGGRTAQLVRSWFLGQGVEVDVTIRNGDFVLDPIRLRESL